MYYPIFIYQVLFFDWFEIGSWKLLAFFRMYLRILGGGSGLGGARGCFCFSHKDRAQKIEETQVLIPIFSFSFLLGVLLAKPRRPENFGAKSIFKGSMVVLRYFGWVEYSVFCVLGFDGHVSRRSIGPFPFD